MEHRDGDSIALERIQDELVEIRRALKGDEFAGKEGALSRLDTVEGEVEDLKLSRATEKAWRAGVIVGLGFTGITSAGAFLQGFMGGP